MGGVLMTKLHSIIEKDFPKKGKDHKRQEINGGEGVYRERKRNSYICFDDVTHTQSSTPLRGYELFRQGSEKFK